MGEGESVKRFPLEWPIGWKRTSFRLEASFRTKATANHRLTVSLSTERLEAELERLGAKNPVLSTNVSLRLDGRPRSDENPRDPGAAIYFSFKGKATVLACDRFVAVADNIAAIAAHIDALRRVETASARSSRRSPATSRSPPTAPRTGARSSGSPWARGRPPTRWTRPTKRWRGRSIPTSAAPMSRWRI